MRTRLAVLWPALFVAACGGGGSPSSPSPPPSATATGVTLSGFDSVRLDNPQRLTLMATMSDGTTRVVQGTWQSSDPGVATVALDGLVAPVASGEVTISAQHEAHRAERRLRVVPDYAGTWDGSYRIAQCAGTKDWKQQCDDNDPNEQFGLDIVFTQNNVTVSGTVAAFSDATVSVSGEIALNGRLSVSGGLQMEFDGVPIKVEIRDWDTHVFEQNRLMNGRFVVVLSSPRFDGDIRYSREITVLNRVTTPSSAGQGPARRTLLRRPR